MATSLGLRALVLRHLTELTESTSTRRRRGAVAVLYLPPAVTAVLVAVAPVDLSDSGGALIAGFSLTAAVLIGVFAQLAQWRDRLLDRARERWLTDAPARRAVDRAVAHVLVGVVGSTIATGAAVLLAAGAHGTTVWSATLALFGVWLLIVIIMIVRSVAVAYEATADPDVRKADREDADPVKHFQMPSQQAKRS